MKCTSMLIMNWISHLPLLNIISYTFVRPNNENTAPFEASNRKTDPSVAISSPGVRDRRAALTLQKTLGGVMSVFISVVLAPSIWSYGA